MHEKEELRVRTSDEATRESYGRISKFFGYIEDWAEKDVREKGLELLKSEEGEKNPGVWFRYGSYLDRNSRGCRRIRQSLWNRRNPGNG
ncbi:hypothetical protein AKJ57_01825 [candidate division MSBL1 archaeon SCGC-AAA259A05]|uniref:Uncharacterized protein n=1 Tax=candidate division MSBL1 archaeon SCGC-AAA259A05 TaxID=1698259 RepID=A0A133UAR0_9EURY|nr:hypothetical protein AKJ57_01825 [candidate division MSBL1 archaeon SCGC-AAA259A05]